jgi:hypothetical protein
LENAEAKAAARVYSVKAFPTTGLSLILQYLENTKIIFMKEVELSGEGTRALTVAGAAACSRYG